MSHRTFPEGLTTRSATEADARIITNLFEAAETADLGAPEISLSDVEASLGYPDFDLDRESLLVFHGDHLVAYADAFHWKADVAIHPDWRGKGLGNAIVGWTEQTALERRAPTEETRIGQTIVDTNSAARDLLVGRGYEPRYTSWVLRLPHDQTLQSGPLPEGYSVRRSELPEDEHAIYRVIEDAFNEWPNRKPSTFENWRAWTLDRPDFDPSLLLVVAWEGRIVGASIGLMYPEEGWIHQIAIERSHRGRGLAKALLSRSFGEMRRRGAPDVGLSTDSRTGALDLYLALGMVVRRSYTHYSLLLRAAV